MHLDHEHDVMHEHMHTHEDGVTHSHPHTHDHEHMHEHTHTHGCEPAACGTCGGCGDLSPKDELKALMKYMVGHNAAHANELAQLAKKLEEIGEKSAYEQVMLAVSDFEKGNMRLSTLLASME